MILELYLLYTIIAFVCFFIALYFNKGINNIFVWPIGILLFIVLAFTSYNIVIDGSSIQQAPLFILNLGIGILSTVLFIWDLIDKFYTGEIL